MSAGDTEYTGETRANSLPKKLPGDHLSPGEQLRLFYATGQTSDPTKARDTRVWQGLEEAPNSVIDFED